MRVAPLKLTSTAAGGWYARKRIPEDVQDAYAKLYGVAWEERWNSNGRMPAVMAQAKARDWLNEIEARINNIRAERKGEGRTLTPQAAHGLAGEWYRWFTARHQQKDKPAAVWDDYYSDLYTEFQTEIWRVSGEGPDPERDPYELLEINPEARKRVRPMVADWAESAQFLHAQGLLLEPASRDMFLDALCGSLFEALRLLRKRADHDYSEDQYVKRFPRFERQSDPGLTPWMLFERWIDEVEPADATVDRWRGVFLKLTEDFPSAAALTAEEARTWARGLITAKRGAYTVRNIWVSAAKTIFAWAVDQHLVADNPFERVKISVPRKAQTRERAFEPEEIQRILAAAAAIADCRSKSKAARRWVPWLCAYTGARVGEITQLRGADVLTQRGIHAINITPHAGTVKTRKSRIVPLHEHLIEQAFLEFVKTSGKGPLFYRQLTKSPAVTDATNPPKPRYAKAREHLAEWVRKLGVTDDEIHPNHAWRHTFARIARRHGMTTENLYAITGWSPKDIGGAYGAPTLEDKAEALKKFPRYVVEAVSLLHHP
jgi:integrase